MLTFEIESYKRIQKIKKLENQNKIKKYNKTNLVRKYIRKCIQKREAYNSTIISRKPIGNEQV